MKAPTAAMYLRSSKDRSDVSIDAQRRELTELAANKGITIVQEYLDVVESAKSENRPGFQSMLRDLKSPTRNWDTILVIDTSRLSRRRYVAHVLNHETERRGIKIVYSKVPEVDPITKVILDSVLVAMDEVHSLMSREKGLAGMAENVRKGYRAGGRAPRGYRLKKIATATMRDGEAVSKSILQPNEDAPIIGRYLKLRAAGTPREKAKRETGLHLSSSTLVGMEWNALTYAGATVWNVHAERDGGAAKGGRKRRPRSDWVIQENTHEPLISAEEAETLISRLEESDLSKSMSDAKTGLSPYLLTGLLKTPSGANWEGASSGKYRYYRTRGSDNAKGKWVRTDAIDGAITAQLLTDMKSPEFITALTREAKAAQSDPTDPAANLRREVSTLTAQIGKATDMALQLDDPAPMLRKVDELETKRKALTDEIRRIEREHSAQAALASISENHVRKLLNDLSADLEALPISKWKDLLKGLVEEVILDPLNLECRIHYRIAIPDRVNMASPRGFDISPVLRAVTKMLVA